jgi:hypothetical protein
MNKGVLMSKRARLGLLTLIVGLLWVFIPERTPHLHLPVVPEMKARTKATMEEKRENKALAISYAKALGYSNENIDCLLTLWTRESRFDHLADNPRSSAYGIAQLLRERSSDPSIQILHGIRYLSHRYGGSACRAKNHSDRRGWY